jgi:Porin subfamily
MRANPGEMSSRSILTGCAICAVLVSSAPARAADMILNAGLPREPVYRCDIAGFIELPSTDICFKIGGHARLVTSGVDTNWTGDNEFVVRNIAVNGYIGGSAGVLPSVGYAFQAEPLQYYGQGRVNFDARTATEYGTVRAFFEGEAEDNDSRTGGDLGLRHAFVQFGNWIFGKTWSTFLDRDARVRRADPYKFVADNSQSIRINQIRYTQAFGNGFSLALAIEDQEYNSPTSAIVGIGPFAPIVDPASTAISVVNDQSNIPNLVGALKWKKDNVGSVQVSGVLHQNKFAELQTIGGVSVPSFVDDELGYGILFGLELKVPTGESDKFTLIAMYLDGASNYQQDLYGTNTEVVWGGCGVANCILDTVTKASISSSFTHYWTPTISTQIAAGYAETDFGALGTATAGLSGAPGVLDVDSFEGLFNIQWEPVRDLKFLFDVHYGYIDYNGFDVDPVEPGIQDSQGAWAAVLQITKSF